MSWFSSAAEKKDEAKEEKKASTVADLIHMTMKSRKEDEETNRADLKKRIKGMVTLEHMASMARLGQGHIEFWVPATVYDFNAPEEAKILVKKALKDLGLSLPVHIKMDNAKDIMVQIAWKA